MDRSQATPGLSQNKLPDVSLHQTSNKFAIKILHSSLLSKRCVLLELAGHIRFHVPALSLQDEGLIKHNLD